MHSKVVKLWQYHSVTRVGEENIIEYARQCCLDDFYDALAKLTAGIQKINNLEDAKAYFENNEYGCISEYELVEVDGQLIEVDIDELGEAYQLHVCFRCGNHFDATRWERTGCPSCFNKHWENK